MIEKKPNKALHRSETHKWSTESILLDSPAHRCL
jgi:hypothetical protein